MKKQFVRIAAFTCFSLMVLLLPSLVHAQAVEESAVSKFSNWLAEFSKEISGQVSGGANSSVKGRVFGFAQGLMVIAFIVVAFMQIFGIMKRRKRVRQMVLGQNVCSTGINCLQ